MNKQEFNKPKLLDIFKFYFYLGIVGYGGPANLGIMKDAFVNKNKWISEKEFMDALSICQIIPGATGVTLSGYLGFNFFGILGAILIPFAFIFPPFIFIVVLAYFYFQYGELTFIKSIMQGLGALVVALIFNAIFQIGSGIFKKITIKDYKGYLIVIFAFLISFFFKQINTIFVIISSGILGLVFYYFTSEFENIGNKKTNEKIDNVPHIYKKIHDYYLLLGIVVLIIIILILPITRQIFYEFFIIGTFGFGGGFTVIPVIQHNIVDVLHWLNLTEFRDGIALGQVTPGSFFISAGFIGYKVYGIIGAMVATIAIFLPSIIIVTSLAKVHTKIKELKIIRIIMKGFLSGFLGIISSSVITFGEASLVDYKTWLIFILVFIWIRVLKKNSIWAILATVIISLFIF